MNWRERAACAGTFSTRFFPSTGAGALPARKICAQCSVQPDCLAYAVADTSLADGVWGGATSKERASIRTRRYTVEQVRKRLDRLR